MSLPRNKTLLLSQKHIGFLSIVFLLFTSSLCSQNFNYEYDHYTIEDGLLDNNILDFDSDSFGNIWVSTRLGVVKCDGNRFDKIDGIDYSKNYLFLKFDSNDQMWLINSIEEQTMNAVEKIEIYTPSNQTQSLAIDMYPELRNLIMPRSYFNLSSDSEKNLLFIDSQSS